MRERLAWYLCRQGPEIARQTGGRLLGLDFSPVAVMTAVSRAASAGLAAFCVGNITATGIKTNAADAVVCLETIMFADTPLDARMPPDPDGGRTARLDVLGGDERRGRAAAEVGTAPGPDA